MATARFAFHPDLNTFLPSGWRDGAFNTSFEDHQTVKHLVEAAGVPHTEIGRLEANSLSIAFDYQVRDGDLVDVWPATAQNGAQPDEMRFVLDNHLGRLAAYLRMLGFDSLYRNNFQDEELAEISSASDRILLTRDRRLLMRKVVHYGYCLRSLDSREQLSEVVERFRLNGRAVAFRRCLRCNQPLEPVSKESVFDQLQPLTQQYYEEFQRCPNCGQIYWKGSHYAHMQLLIEQITKGET